MATQTKSWLIASDLGDGRDGIGVELYIDNKLLLEIFRDDAKKVREVTLYQKDVPLEIVEEAIAKFKQELVWEFLEETYE